MEMHESGTRHRWRVLNMTFLAYLYDSLDLQILAICMQVIVASLGLSLTDAGWLASATMVGTAIGGILFGRAAENWGRKNAAVLCLIEFGIFTAAVYWVTSWEQLMVLRFLQGIGRGGLWGPSVALVADHRARAAGFMLSTFAVGGILSFADGTLPAQRSGLACAVCDGWNSCHRRRAVLDHRAGGAMQTMSSTHRPMPFWQAARHVSSRRRRRLKHTAGRMWA